MELPPPIGKYELKEFLGGGMSHVYRAQDTVIGRTVAVKILTEEGCADAETKARFLQEARMAGNVAHDNIINIYDFGENEGRPFMVMEFLRGEDLRHAIKNGRTGDLRNKLKVALQIARALEYIHTQKIVHRDIKPENVHITEAGNVKLMDFGIAKSASFSMTRAGYVLGTPYYMAPEQVLGKETTDLVDVYAFGVLLFELMVGVKPISGDSVERIFYSILHEPLNLEPLRKANIPEPVCDLVARCTAKNPAERPQHFNTICRELEGMIESLETPPPPPPRPQPTQKKWILPLALLVLVTVLAGVYFFLQPGRKPPLAAKISTPTGEMVLVPEGSFLSGEAKKPEVLRAFYVDKTEVTNRAYADFCAKKPHPLPENFSKERPDFPVENITFVDAQAFAKWAGKRLPSMLEWEKAARGTDGRLYPWGNEPDQNRANVGDPKGGLVPVATMEKGASPYGALHMAGNVWELVDETRVPTPEAVKYYATRLPPPPATAVEPWCVIKGGSFKEKLDPRVTYDFATVPARYYGPAIGFRCVKDP